MKPPRFTIKSLMIVAAMAAMVSWVYVQLTRADQEEPWFLVLASALAIVGLTLFAAGAIVGVGFLVSFALEVVGVRLAFRKRRETRP